MRGVAVVQVPTTLLAQVDSSVGGKTGVNSRAGKNMIGAFHQPAAVVADTRTLATLPRRELTAGWCEAIKQGAVGDRKLFERTREFLAEEGRPADARARAEDKPIFLSVGYSSCYWCHVMERESFEDPETAAVMNENFVNIKVDRE